MLLSHFVDKINLPPRRGRDRPRMTPVDEKAVSAPHALPPQGEPQASPELQIQALARHGQYPMSPSTTIA